MKNLNKLVYEALESFDNEKEVSDFEFVGDTERHSLAKHIVFHLIANRKSIKNMVKEEK